MSLHKHINKHINKHMTAMVNKADALMLAMFLTVTFMMVGCTSLLPAESSSNRAEANPKGVYNTEVYQQPIDFFEPILIDDRVAQLRLEERVDHLFLVIDEQAGENEIVRGISTQAYINEIVERFSATLPDRNYSGAYMIVNGGISAELANITSQEGVNPLILEQGANYTSADLMPRIQVGSLSQGIGMFTHFIKQTKSRGALILVASSSQINKQVEGAVVAMRRATRYKSKTPDLGACFYVVGIGDKLPRKAMETVDSCGFLTAADDIVLAKDMSNFVEQVLYKGPADTDGDGIFDYQDQCPNTPSDRIVDYVGCLRFK